MANIPSGHQPKPTHSNNPTGQASGANNPKQTKLENQPGVTQTTGDAKSAQAQNTQGTPGNPAIPTPNTDQKLNFKTAQDFLNLASSAKAQTVHFSSAHAAEFERILGEDLEHAPGLIKQFLEKLSPEQRETIAAQTPGAFTRAIEAMNADKAQNTQHTEQRVKATIESLQNGTFELTENNEVFDVFALMLVMGKLNAAQFQNMREGARSNMNNILIQYDKKASEIGHKASLNRDSAMVQAGINIGVSVASMAISASAMTAAGDPGRMMVISALSQAVTSAGQSAGSMAGSSIKYNADMVDVVMTEIEADIQSGQYVKGMLDQYINSTSQGTQQFMDFSKTLMDSLIRAQTGMAQNMGA